ncbi:hypothetical protein AJ78_03870 [Emergomyces pasteurianus Ep9510]|uniref:Leucine rich repeat protein n=1 Tax=Emergomyces pasteurianus Ep9510 TaxID=1447872 RepID=A0A1J9QID3_9EURO|nr:hypothetical protein AJ78_03870 [Emergomyces pasteurianus Ep9510]
MSDCRLQPDQEGSWKLTPEQRKVRGIKAGLAVVKDLKKRVPPGLGSRAAARDPHVEIDLTGKELTDEGFAVFVNGLINCIQYRDEEHPKGSVRLIELVVKGNALTIASMKKLGLVVALSCDCLTQLDISDNRISVRSREQREAWQDFLESFQGCYLLKKVDFGGNPLGGAGFDVFVRVYAQSDLYFIEPLADERAKNQIVTDTPDVLNNISMEEEKENRKPLGNATLGERIKEGHKDSLKGFRPKVKSQGVQLTEGSNYRSARGLRSVPYLVFSNCCTTNACAFHLWTLVLSHRQPNTLLEFLPPSKSVGPLEQTNPTNGIVYTPNEKLSVLGRRLLELGNEFRMQNYETDAEDTEPYGFDKEFGESDITKRRELHKKSQIEMDRVKNRLLLDVLKTDGIRITGIWNAALRMMRAARAILLDDGTRPMKPTATIDDRNLIELHTANEGLTHEYLTDDCLTDEYPKNEYIKNRYSFLSPLLQQGEGFLEDFPTIQETLEGHNREGLNLSWEQGLQGGGNTTSRRMPRNRKDSVVGAKNVLLKFEGKGDTGRFGVPMDIWRRIIADAVGASEFLTVEQQFSVLWYASDWQAIKQELRISGGKEFEQIWKILSSMGCLSYAHH